MAVKEKAQLILDINQYIKQNGNGEISGTILNQVLIDVVDSIFNLDNGSGFVPNNYLYGAGAPISSTGTESDVYLDTQTGDIYARSNAVWSLVYQPAFTTSVYHGSGAPAGALGIDLDYYLDNDNGQIYNKQSGSWVLIYTPTVDASLLLYGSGVPLVGNGENGNYYLDIDTGDMYYKDSGVWNLIFDFPDIPARTGQFRYGNGIPGAGLGENDDHYLDVDTGDIYIKAAGSWSIAYSFPTIPNSYLSGSGVPGAGLGIDGDHYLDQDTGNTYKKASGSWSLINEVYQTLQFNYSDGNLAGLPTYEGIAIPTFLIGWEIIETMSSVKVADAVGSFQFDVFFSPGDGVSAGTNLGTVTHTGPNIVVSGPLTPFAIPGIGSLSVAVDTGGIVGTWTGLQVTFVFRAR